MDSSGAECDVLVVGAGAAGILVALGLTRRGYSVTLLDSSGLAAEQSNHSHGYLHRGYIYQAPTLQLVRQLNRGADEWLALFEGAGLDPVCETSLVGFTNRYNGLRAGKRWAKCQLPVNLVEPPEFVVPGRLRSVFATPESAFDFTAWYQRSLEELIGSVRFLHGQAIALVTDDRRVCGVRVRCSGADVILKAGTYVATAGTGNIELVESAVTLRGRGVNRTSFMLVLEGDLPLANLIVADNDAYGLFMVSRRREGKTVWLVSNYLSFAHQIAGTLATSLWLRATAKTLHWLTGVLDRDVTWSVYVAGKGELRADPRSLSEHSLETYGFRNLVVGSPSKLTLAPLLAREIVSHIETRQRATGSRPSGLPASTPKLAPERWTLCRMQPGHSLRRFLTDARWDTDDVIEAAAQFA
jgi:glycine/D-amino acid oxidase-like deaminating enzyme